MIFLCRNIQQALGEIIVIWFPSSVVWKSLYTTLIRRFWSHPYKTTYLKNAWWSFPSAASLCLDLARPSLCVTFRLGEPPKNSHGWFVCMLVPPRTWLFSGMDYRYPSPCRKLNIRRCHDIREFSQPITDLPFWFCCHRFMYHRRGKSISLKAELLTDDTLVFMLSI